MRYVVVLEDILTEVREHSEAMQYGKLTLELTFHEGSVSKYQVSKETPVRGACQKKSPQKP